MKYALLLNNMLQPNIENINIVKISENKEELVDWYKSFLTEPYQDGKWGKTFKRGSPLEWFNPVYNLDKLNDFWGGIWEVNDKAEIGMGLSKG